jgi:hypothetical protein
MPIFSRPTILRLSGSRGPYSTLELTLPPTTRTRKAGSWTNLSLIELAADVWNSKPGGAALGRAMIPGNLLRHFCRATISSGWHTFADMTCAWMQLRTWVYDLFAGLFIHLPTLLLPAPEKKVAQGPVATINSSFGGDPARFCMPRGCAPNAMCKCTGETFTPNFYPAKSSPRAGGCSTPSLQENQG